MGGNIVLQSKISVQKVVNLVLSRSNSVLVERMCRRTDRSKAFVTNHIRDVVYMSDLEQAMRISLSLWGRQYDYYRSRRKRREDAEKERRLVLGFDASYMQLFGDLSDLIALQSTSGLRASSSRLLPDKPKVQA